jgi:YcaO-like protein with predicted kinase domain
MVVAMRARPVTAVKGFRDGTDRLVSPEDTLDRLRPFLDRAGITRVANVTGLDVIGVPVVMACRPNSRGVAASQGKGLTLAAARASAVMESIESFHAESIVQPLVYASAGELSDRRVLDIARLPTRGPRPATRARRMLWITGRDLRDGGEVSVPYDLVHTDFTLDRRPGDGMFHVTSSGLAGGNHVLEATSHALYELIERDAAALWALRDEPDRDAARLDLSTVDDAGCRWVLDRLCAASVAVAVWDMTSDVGIACFGCQIAEDPAVGVLPALAAGGYGCHPRREIALLRALTEAVQSRLTYISGVRDDMFRASYAALSRPATRELAWTRVTAGTAARRFAEVPTAAHDSFDADVSLALERLAAVGLEEAVVVDLTRPDMDIPVVRVVVPGLESLTGGPARPGTPGRRTAGGRR